MLPLRFIPTHVGNTVRFACAGSVAPVHPHACGEHVIAKSDLAPKDGSSPRMWGTQVAAWSEAMPIGFIPTHVGNTGRCRARCRRPPVHPHACGEHFPDNEQNSDSPGSSPRMWGTLLLHFNDLGAQRFIPTHVGNTTVELLRDEYNAVHPHACGEH